MSDVLKELISKTNEVERMVKFAMQSNALHLKQFMQQVEKGINNPMLEEIRMKLHANMDILCDGIISLRKVIEDMNKLPKD